MIARSQSRTRSSRCFSGHVHELRHAGKVIEDEVTINRNENNSRCDAMKCQNHRETYEIEGIKGGKARALNIIPIRTEG